MDEPNWPSNEALEELRKTINSTNEKYVFVRMNTHVDSYSGLATMLSIHETLEGAIEAIPENIRKVYPNREIYDDWVANFVYEAVKKVRLER